MAGYETITGLENIYLEDSWVLDVQESDASLTFALEAVLTEQHPQWKPRKPGEVHSYRRLRLTFPNLRHVEWLSRGGPPAMDTSGELDYGHIDTFVVSDHSYELTGDWGHVRVESDAPQISDH